MKILDRYISSALTGAFIFGISVFMALLLAMNLLKELIEMITVQNIPVAIAVKIFLLQVPGMLQYAFPMSVLLGILLVFNKMSSESEMVAIRAAGVSFTRIMLPAAIFACLITALTFVTSNYLAPAAGAKAVAITQQTLEQARKNRVNYLHEENDRLQYSFIAGDFNVKEQKMSDLALTFYEGELPAVMIIAKTAVWDTTEGRWMFRDASLRVVKPDATGFWLMPKGQEAEFDIQAYALRLEESPFDIAMARRRPEEVTAAGIKVMIGHLVALGRDKREVNKWRMELAHRFSVPFACLVFALVAAPLGLRHHRTSSSVGLGFSLVIIIIYYFVTHYMNIFGKSGVMAPWLAAWLPNFLGSILGVVLIVRANK